jgi:hypothetical protein
MKCCRQSSSFRCDGAGRRGVFRKSSAGMARRHSDIWWAAACHSGDLGFELCYLPDMPAVLRTLGGAENSVERWWQQLEATQKHPEGSFKVVNALAMAASFDPDPTQFLGIRPPVTFYTCEVTGNAGRVSNRHQTDGPRRRSVQEMGTMKWYNAMKGFGFIVPDSAG